jgi:hypothetical protein
MPPPQQNRAQYKQTLVRLAKAKGMSSAFSMPLFSASRTSNAENQLYQNNPVYKISNIIYNNYLRRLVGSD